MVKQNDNLTPRIVVTPSTLASALGSVLLVQAFVC